MKPIHKYVLSGQSLLILQQIIPWYTGDYIHFVFLLIIRAIHEVYQAFTLGNIILELTKWDFFLYNRSVNICDLM